LELFLELIHDARNDEHKIYQNLFTKFCVGFHYTISPKFVQHFRRRNVETLYITKKCMSVVNVRMISYVTLLISRNTKYDRCGSKQTMSRSRIHQQWMVGITKTSYVCTLNILKCCYIEFNTLKCSCILQNFSGYCVCVSMERYVSNYPPLKCCLYVSSSMTLRPNFGPWSPCFRGFETIMLL
jgi:hypothetical protein